MLNKCCTSTLPHGDVLTQGVNFISPCSVAILLMCTIVLGEKELKILWFHKRLICEHVMNTGSDVTDKSRSVPKSFHGSAYQEVKSIHQRENRLRSRSDVLSRPCWCFVLCTLP